MLLLLLLLLLPLLLLLLLLRSALGGLGTRKEGGSSGLLLPGPSPPLESSEARTAAGGKCFTICWCLVLRLLFFL